MTSSEPMAAKSLNLPNIPEPWERLEGEPAKAFALFATYRDLPAHDRSLRRAVEVQREESGTGGRRGGGLVSALRQATTWSAQWHWVVRVEQHDLYLDRRRREAQVREVEEMGSRHAREAVVLQEKALKRLKRMKLDDMSARDTLRYITEGAKLERLARGEPDSHVAVSPGGGVMQENVRELLETSPNVAKAAADLVMQMARESRETARARTREGKRS